MKLTDILGAAVALAYALAVMATAVKLAPPCDRHVRDWGDLSLRGPDACVDHRPRLAALTAKEGN